MISNTAIRMPTASPRPHPVTATAPTLMITAPTTIFGDGHLRWLSGPATANTMGMQATAAPSSPGSACRVPRIVARLKPTSPDRAPPMTQPMSPRRGRTIRIPSARPRIMSVTAATAYRSDCTAKTGKF